MSVTAEIEEILQEVVLPAILVVEDEKMAREALAHILMGRGYAVTTSEDGSSAILRARKEETGVVLMDIALGEGLDGIDAARRIQDINPFTSFIFVSAYIENPDHVQRVKDYGIRVGGWIEKPLTPGPKLDELLRRIDREQKKLSLLIRIEDIRRQSFNAISCLRSLADSDPSISPDIVEELSREFQSEMAGDGGAFSFREDAHRVSQIDAEIDALYDQIWRFISEGSVTAVDSLRERLRQLQNEEADIFEHYVRGQLRFDSDHGRKLTRETQELIRRYKN